MKLHLKSIIYIFLTASLFFNCGGTSSGVISTPMENIDSMPLKVSPLIEKQKQSWGHLDLVNDTVPGMSVYKAYEEIIKNKKGQTTVVAVIDSGIDIDHEDLDGVIWTNTKEIPNNGKDDDNNGYIDDVHGWNFLGDGYNEQLEYVRLLASGDSNNPRYTEAQNLYTKEVEKYTTYKAQYEQIKQRVSEADDVISKYLKNKNYTKEELNAIKTDDQSLQQSVSIIKYVYSLNMESVAEFMKEINEGLLEFNDRLNYNLNKDFKGRKTADNPDVLNDKPGYGNGNVKPTTKTESHGTHVAGIIAAERGNRKGIDGVANNVQIMALRAVPNGDEYDKDIALAIRYAVDNGAKVINGSFGKSFSPHSNWVKDAIVYASDRDVIFVHASGNDGEDLDSSVVFPNDQTNNGVEISNTFITVGSLDFTYGSKLVSSFSNFGKINVDIFAPGGEIYSTTPGNEYDYKDGTSMAAPGVAGIVALIRSQHPGLKASDVKNIVVNSGLQLTTKVIVAGEAYNIKPFNTLSKYGKIANAYNALIMANELSKNQ